MNESNAIPSAGFVRLRQIIGTPERPGPVPVSRATWYAWIRKGHAPAPVKIGPRASAWRADEIRAFVERLNDGG